MLVLSRLQVSIAKDPRKPVLCIVNHWRFHFKGGRRKAANVLLNTRSFSGNGETE
jgi:hypothetical protein